jgi:hypothetical protein
MTMPDETEAGVIDVTVTDAEVIDGELVPVEHSRADKAIALAAEEAFKSSGIPDRNEFLSLAMMARTMSMSGIVPKALQNKPADTFIVLLTGRDLGIPVTSAINQIHVIDGRPSLAPKLLNARIRKLGLGKIVPGERSTEKAEAIAYGPHGERLGPATVFTWADAQEGRLVGKGCQPGAHARDCKCRQGYKTWPQRMLWWRAAGWCADDYFPEASLGLYSPEELGAVVDEEGVPIDPGTAPLPQGFEDVARGHADAVDPPNDPADTAKLKATIAALPDEQKADLRNQWTKRQLPPVDQLTTSKASFAWAMVRAHVTIAERAGTMGEIAQMPQEPESDPSAPGPTPEPETPQEPQAEPDPVKSDPDAPDPDLEAARVAVALIPAKGVDHALGERLLVKTGNVEERRERLAQALAAEAKEDVNVDLPY